MRTIFTDLAMESAKGYGRTQQMACGIERTRVDIGDEQTAERLGRPVGTYVTLSCPQTLSMEMKTRSVLARELSRTLRAMLPEGAQTVLVAGLGNRAVTPDALGPRTAERVLVTRHMRGCLPEDVAARMKDVCAASPGVLGVTGIETAEALTGVAEHIRPDAMIVVDALAARSTRRIGTTIQVTDTGILPGSGVGNHRRAVDRKTMGMPVIAMGVPTVVHASAIVRDALEAMAEREQTDGTRLGEYIEQVVTQRLGEMIVTPREVDALTERMAGVLAEGINLALHPELSAREIEQLTAQ